MLVKNNVSYIIFITVFLHFLGKEFYKMEKENIKKLGFYFIQVKDIIWKPS